MTRRTLVLAALLVPLIGVSACGELGTREGGGVVGRLLGGILPGNAQAASAPLQRPGYTLAELGANPDAYLFFTINALDLVEPARRVAASGGNETFEAESGFTAAFQDGMLVATHGLAFDLISSEGAETRAALRRGGGEVNRAIEVMDSLDQLQRIDFRCTITAQGSEAVDLGTRQVTLRKFTENCTSSALAFENLFWLDAAGDIVSSRQYVSPTVAYLRSNRL